MYDWLGTKTLVRNFTKSKTGNRGALEKEITHFLLSLLVSSLSSTSFLF